MCGEEVDFVHSGNVDSALVSNYGRAEMHAAYVTCGKIISGFREDQWWFVDAFDVT